MELEPGDMVVAHTHDEGYTLCGHWIDLAELDNTDDYVVFEKVSHNEVQSAFTK